MKTPLTYSQSGMNLTEQFEGYASVPYQDEGGIWTNGYGNTHGVVPGQIIGHTQAIADLRANVQNSVNDVNRLVDVQLTQGEFDALVDFDFNLGRGRLGKSTLLLDLNRGDYQAAANQFEKWDQCDGKVVAGLLRRRIAEEKEFKS